MSKFTFHPKRERFLIASQSQITLPKKKKEFELLNSTIHSSRLIQHITAIRKLSDLTVFCLKALESAFFTSNNITEFSPPEEYIKTLDSTAGRFLIESAKSFEKHIEQEFVKKLSGISYSLEFFNAAKLIVGDMQETPRLKKIIESDESTREKSETERSICSSILEKIEEFKGDIKFAPDSLRDLEFENNMKKSRDEEDKILIEKKKFVKNFDIDLTKFALDSEKNIPILNINDSLTSYDSTVKENNEAFTFYGSKRDSLISENSSTQTIQTLNLNEKKYSLGINDITSTMKKNKNIRGLKREFGAQLNLMVPRNSELETTERAKPKFGRRKSYLKKERKYCRPPKPQNGFLNHDKRFSLMGPVNVIELQLEG